MNVGRLAALVALTLAVARVASPQATPSLVIRVVERTTQQPLPNAEVIDLDGGARRFTNHEGETRLAWGPTGRLRLRVRQLGFQFVEQDVANRSQDVRGSAAYCLLELLAAALSSRGATAFVILRSGTVATRDLVCGARNRPTSDASKIPRRSRSSG